MYGLKVIATAILSLFAVERAEVAQDGARNSKPTIVDCTLLDLAGQVRRVGLNGDRQATAVVFLSTECPIANGYIPELNRLAADLRKRQPDVALYGVLSDRFVTREEAVRHSQE